MTTSQTVTLSVPELDALLAALDGYTAHPCGLDHRHRRNADCDGWAPIEVADLARAQDTIGYARRLTR